MPRKKLPYQEGDLFTIPLEDDKYALGLVARSDKKGAVFGYFFSWDAPEIPKINGVKTLDVSDAVDVCMFGDLHFLNNSWQVLGQYPHWNRNEWPMPPLARKVLLTDIYLATEYDEKTFHPVRQWRISKEEALNLPREGMSGARAVELVLTHIIIHGKTLPTIADDPPIHGAKN